MLNVDGYGYRKLPCTRIYQQLLQPLTYIFGGLLVRPLVCGKNSQLEHCPRAPWRSPSQGSRSIGSPSIEGYFGVLWSIQTKIGHYHLLNCLRWLDSYPPFFSTANDSSIGLKSGLYGGNGKSM